MDAREQARRLLPWALAPRFHNVITSVKVEGKLAVMKRNIEVYETSVGGIMIPGASLFLYEPYLNSEYAVRMTGRDKGVIVIRAVDGFVAGFMPNGKYAKFTSRVFKSIVGKQIEFSGAEPSEFTVNMVVRRLARIETAKYFASKVRYALRDEGWHFYHLGTGTLKKVYVREGNVSAEVVIKTNFFSVSYRGEEVTAPGIVPGILEFFKDKELSVVRDDKTRDQLLDFINRVADVGSSFASISILQRATRSTFSYVVGEVDKDTIPREYARNRYLWVTGSPAYKGVRANIHVDTHSGKILLSLTFVPFVPPASLVLNYPPFHIAPLAAMVRDRSKLLRYLADTTEKRLARKGIDAVVYADELEPLSDSGVGFDDIKRVLKEGYPKLDTLDAMLDKMTRVEDVAEVASLTYGEVRKIDEIIVSEIKPRRSARAEPEEQEAEDVGLADVTL